MKFKIGDKVFGKDVVNKSYYTGRIIEINHNLADWASYCIATVYGEKWLINDTITKVEEGKLRNKQEIKEKLKENGAWCTECHTGEEGRYVEIGKAMELIEQLDEPQKPEELVTEQPEEIMIPVSLVYQVLQSEPTNREIKAFLKGYKEGLNNY